MHFSSLFRRATIAATVAGAVVAGAVGAVLIASPASAAVRSDDSADAACVVSSAQLSWGFKESFRSYISGTIARGAWEVVDGAAYSTPVFSWSGGTGAYDPSAGTGSVAFTGGIHFTGHDGLLDSLVQNPTLVLTGPTTAQLLLDVSGVSMENALAGDETVDAVVQIPFADVDLSAMTVVEEPGGVTVEVADAPVAITADGFAAFGNYETGTALDPLTFTAVAACASEPTPTPTPEPAMTTLAAETPSTDADSGWLVWAGAGAVIVAAGVVAAIVIVRRRTGGGVS